MAVVAQVLNDGPKNHTVHLEIALANTTAAVVDASALTGITNLRLESAEWSLTGAGAQILWDATANTVLLEMSVGEGSEDYSRIGGIPNPQNTGFTGDVLLTNVAGLTNGTAVLHFKKS